MKDPESEYPLKTSSTTHHNATRAFITVTVSCKDLLARYDATVSLLLTWKCWNSSHEECTSRFLEERNANIPSLCRRLNWASLIGPSETRAKMKHILQFIDHYLPCDLSWFWRFIVFHCHLTKLGWMMNGMALPRAPLHPPPRESSIVLERARPLEEFRYHLSRLFRTWPSFHRFLSLSQAIRFRICCWKVTSWLDPVGVPGHPSKPVKVFHGFMSSHFGRTLKLKTKTTLETRDSLKMKQFEKSTWTLRSWMTSKNNSFVIAMFSWNWENCNSKNGYNHLQGKREYDRISKNA